MKQIIFILLLIPYLSISQETTPDETIKLDSLFELFNKTSNKDTLKVLSLISIADIYYAKNPDTTIIICEKAKELSEAINFKQGEARSNSFLGFLYQFKGDFDIAKKYHYKSININQKLNKKKEIANSMNNLGYIYFEQGFMTKALNHFSKSYELRVALGDKKGAAQSLMNIGVIYKEQGDYGNALKNYKEGLKINRKINYKSGEANCLNNIGNIYFNLNDFDQAFVYYKKSLKIREEIGEKYGIAESLGHFGSVYANKNEAEKAIEYYQKSLIKYQEIGAKLGESSILHMMGMLEFKRENYIKAKEYEQRSFTIANDMGALMNIRNATETLSSIYVKLGNSKEALKMYKLHIQMRDSLNNEETLKATAQQQAKYEYEKQKAIDDAQHEKKIAIEQEAKVKQKVITYVTAGSLGLVIFFLVFVFNRLQVTKKQKIVIETQKIEVEKQKTVVELAHSELEEKNKEITDSIQYAKRIQNAILPSAKVVKEYLQESFILYKPKDIVAGDFYWLEHRDNIILFAAADCTGHGVPGAMVSVVCNNGLNRSVREFGLTDPGEILNKTREIVIAEFEKSEEEVKDGMDIALCSLKQEDGRWRLKYAGANNPLWVIRDGKLIETKANKQPIGKFDNPEPYTTHTMELQKEDSIYIFSDGYVDQFGGEKGKKFKAQAFRELLLSVQNKSMEEQQVIINEAFENWKGNLEQIDDVCVIGVKI